jgi:hypothetical protein
VVEEDAELGTGETMPAGGQLGGRRASTMRCCADVHDMRRVLAEKGDDGERATMGKGGELGVTGKHQGDGAAWLRKAPGSSAGRQSWKKARCARLGKNQGARRGESGEVRRRAREPKRASAELQPCAGEAGR